MKIPECSNNYIVKSCVESENLIGPRLILNLFWNNDISQNFLLIEINDYKTL